MNKYILFLHFVQGKIKEENEKRKKEGNYFFFR